ncbi:MAG: 4-hydroxy-tetrahydrodipicolinate reductase [Bacteroidales bacterium]
MKIALIGYGKMGRTIEELAIQRDHKIELKIDENNIEDFTEENLRRVDVAIEFSTPHVAYQNIIKCINSGVPVVSGTTGWLSKFDEVVELCKTENGALFYASNFSLGVNIFFKINQYLSKLMAGFTEFDISIEETHHIHKLDAPSGTAITIAEDIIKNNPHKNGWIREMQNERGKIPIHSIRVGEVPGTHIVKYDSPIETIEIEHSSKSRKGLAMGAITAAEFLLGKTGVFGMDDLLALT